MLNTTDGEQGGQRGDIGVRLRMWPGVAILLVVFFARFVVPAFVPEAGAVGAISALLGGLLFVVWWLFFSRAAWADRWLGLGAMLAALMVARLMLHESLATAGMGVMYFIYAIPPLCAALVIWLWMSRSAPKVRKRLSLLLAVVLASGCWPLLRTEGVGGDGASQFSLRWVRTPEERMLAEGGIVPSPGTSSLDAPPQGSWVGFRGLDRDGVVRGPRLEMDWVTNPPRELWRRPVGPGWSSFALAEGVAFTQEQRGEVEVVSAYRASSGELAWQHEDPTRFWESNAGAGPRATPALKDGRLYSVGATGLLNALQASDGSVLWARNAASDTGAKVPDWGFSGSPLVVDDLLIVHVGALAAYDLQTGEPRWISDASGSYSSPHLATIQGVRQILMLSNSGAAGVSLADGKQLWQHDWTGGIVQPAVTPNGDVLVSAGGLTGGLGIRRIAVEQSAEGWSTQELWTSNRLKPNFNDFVVHNGHAYGFDGRILACLDLADGERKWKGGRYGNGQLILLADQDALLVISEKGDLALVAAKPDGFEELATVPAIEGKTWNHPALVGNLLLVRNDREMAAFQLALADD